MKRNYSFIFYFTLFLLSACAEKKTGDTIPPNTVQQLQKLSELRTEAEKKDDLKNFLAYYNENAISMPEYQPTLQGINEIEAFYKEIFQRQNIKTFQRKAEEFIDLGKTIIEFGTFKKEYTDSKADTLLTQNGKYWNIWDVLPNGNFKLKGEAFGFFHPVKNPEALVVQLNKTPSDKSAAYADQQIPFELRAYNALMEKYVRNGEGALRSEFYTNDVRVMPFADSTKTGMGELKPYLVAYDTHRGGFTIDSISVYTYHYEYFNNYVLEYPKFLVKWSTPQNSGRTEGKGVRIWKRQADKSLKMYREIGTHNHLE